MEDAIEEIAEAQKERGLIPIEYKEQLIIRPGDEIEYVRVLNIYISYFCFVSFLSKALSLSLYLLHTHTLSLSHTHFHCIYIHVDHV